MVIIQGTDKIRGVLSLASTGLQVEKGKAFRIADDQYQTPEVQTAISMGFLKVAPGANMVADYSGGGSADKMVRCRNEFERSLTMNSFPHEIKPGQVFSITEKDLNSPDVKAAISKGYIRVIESTQGKIPMPETTINISDSLLKKQKEAKGKRNIEMLETNEEISTPDQEVVPKEKLDAVMLGSEPKPKRGIQFDASVIDTPNPKPVKAENKKTTSIIWNPAKNPIMNQMKTINASKKNNDDLTFVDKEQDKAKRKSHPVLKDKPDEIIDEELGFVDQEQEKELIESHPILKNKQTEELEFVDQEQEKQRINAHPVLKSKESE